MLKNICHRLNPILFRKNILSAMQHFLNRMGIHAIKLPHSLHLARLKRRVWSYPPKQVVHFLRYSIRILDGPDFYIQYKDFFVRRIYHFVALRSDPLIIDGGSNVGMSILYFKHCYPQSRIIGFEPDPSIYNLLQENMDRNRLTGITLINAGLSDQNGVQDFIPDGKSGGHIAQDAKGMSIQVEKLSHYLNESVDLLKLNIEGVEWAVLREAAQSGKLQNIREIIIEYHGWPTAPQRLGEILNLLDQEGFRYLLHDFDQETCGTSKPPFHIEKDTKWFCLVYARRMKA